MRPPGSTRIAASERPVQTQSPQVRRAPPASGAAGGCPSSAPPSPLRIKAFGGARAGKATHAHALRIALSSC